jgi:hypothetical protein
MRNEPAFLEFAAACANGIPGSQFWFSLFVLVFERHTRFFRLREGPSEFGTIHESMNSDNIPKGSVRVHFEKRFVFVVKQGLVMLRNAWLAGSSPVRRSSLAGTNLPTSGHWRGTSQDKVSSQLRRRAMLLEIWTATVEPQIASLQSNVSFPLTEKSLLDKIASSFPVFFQEQLPPMPSDDPSLAQAIGDTAIRSLALQLASSSCVRTVTDGAAAELHETPTHDLRPYLHATEIALTADVAQRTLFRYLKLANARQVPVVSAVAAGLLAVAASARYRRCFESQSEVSLLHIMVGITPKDADFVIAVHVARLADHHALWFCWAISHCPSYIVLLLRAASVSLETMGQFAASLGEGTSTEKLLRQWLGDGRLEACNNSDIANFAEDLLQGITTHALKHEQGARAHTLVAACAAFVRLANLAHQQQTTRTLRGNQLRSHQAFPSISHRALHPDTLKGLRPILLHGLSRLRFLEKDGLSIDPVQLLSTIVAICDSVCVTALTEADHGQLCEVWLLAARAKLTNDCVRIAPHIAAAVLSSLHGVFRAAVARSRENLQEPVPSRVREALVTCTIAFARDALDHQRRGSESEAALEGDPCAAKPRARPTELLAACEQCVERTLSELLEAGDDARAIDLFASLCDAGSLRAAALSIATIDGLTASVSLRIRRQTQSQTPVDAHRAVLVNLRRLRSKRLRTMGEDPVFAVSVRVSCAPVPGGREPGTLQRNDAGEHTTAESSPFWVLPFGLHVPKDSASGLRLSHSLAANPQRLAVDVVEDFMSRFAASNGIVVNCD